MGEEMDPQTRLDELTEPLIERAEGGATLPEGAAARPSGATLPEAVVLIQSVYVGLGLLSQPYAFKLGGWVSLALLASTTAMFTVSALLLPLAFELLPSGVPHSYPNLGAVALGGAPGKAAVTSLAGIEMFGSLAIACVVCYAQLELLLPSQVLGLSPTAAAVAITAAALAVMLTARDVSGLAPLATTGSLASCFVVLTVLSLLWMDPHKASQQQPPAGHHAFRWPGALQSVGIFAVSSSGHSVLPAVRAAMRDQRRFPAAVLIAFGAMAAVYATVASIGYWYWGDAVSTVLTVDLSTNSPYASAARRAGGGLLHWLPVDRLLAALVLVNCAGKVPALVMVVEDLITGAATRGSPPDDHSAAADRPPPPGRRYMVRLAVGGAAVLLAWAARDVLGSVLGLVGGACSMATSLVLPTCCYASLSWRVQGRVRQAGLATLVGIGCSLLVLVTALNLQELIAAGGGGGGG